MENNLPNVLRFDLTPRQVKFKNILNKEFVELEIYAISDADPNRNKSHFTFESMKKLVESGGVKNKPIVGFFERGDFTTHEGSAAYDPELESTYWDTLKGERILGWVRESDKVEIVEEDGLHWIRFTCVLCVKYCYNQVKRLLKDRRKKVSVEITVNDGVVRDDGVLDIITFALNGTTILGSKYGKPVEEGIEGAHLSILDRLSGEEFSEQKKVVSFAYDQINGIDGTQTNEKGVSTMDENKELSVQTQNDGAAFAATDDQTKDPEGNKDGEGTTNCKNSCNDCGGSEPVNEGGSPDDAQMSGEGDGNGGSTGEGDPKPEDDPEKKPEDDDECKHALECKMAEMEAKIAELEENCKTFQEEAASAKAEFEAVSASVNEYKNRAEAAEALVAQFKSEKLKAFAVSIMTNEHIAKEDYDRIIADCDAAKYACEEDIKKDVAYAVFNARPTGSAGVSMPIVTTPSVDDGSADMSHMTREQRIAARVKKH